MDPVFTLQWPEFILANRLRKLLPKAEGYSVLIPLSRQEKGIDLAVIRKMPEGASRVATIQVKASRTYMPERKSTRSSAHAYRYRTWFNRFDVPMDADFVFLFGMYAPQADGTAQVSRDWYREATLVFTSQEMKNFMSNCFAVNGNPDRMFGFGFDDETKIIQTRGDKDRKYIDFTDFSLERRIAKIKDALANA